MARCEQQVRWAPSWAPWPACPWAARRQLLHASPLMRCASIALQFSGKFKGDGEAMLSALIRACEVKPISPAANPAWAGRELVPWTDDSVQVEACLEFQPLETSSRWAPPRVVSNGEG